MPIRLQCSCGRQLRLRDETAGKKVRCPDCRQIIPVPLPSRKAAPNPKAVAKTPADAARGDDGEIDFDELAELERASDTVQDEFAVRCPQCVHNFTAQASSRNAKATCPKCAARFRIGNHEADRFGLFDAAPPVGGTDRCAQCGSPIDAGDVLCDSCAGGMAAGVAARHRAESRAHAHGVFDKLGVIRLLDGLLVVLCGLVGIVASAVIFALIETSEGGESSTQLMLPVALGIGGLLWQAARKKLLGRGPLDY